MTGKSKRLTDGHTTTDANNNWPHPHRHRATILYHMGVYSVGVVLQRLL